ncbi:CsbD family protein [Acetobacteraceae bacterium ESL0709]|nr:CsbD family protein [Acetobacteraceae bacterium ESL0697]MDF7678655.1 CsbD family protein [Acetobacteraceae bacterium ESL0709]
MVDSISTKAEGLLDEASGRVKDAVGGLRGDLGQQIGGKAEAFKGHAKQEFADLYDANESKLEAATSFIQDRPVISLLIVSIVGLVIGRLLFRKRA